MTESDWGNKADDTEQQGGTEPTGAEPADPKPDGGKGGLTTETSRDSHRTARHQQGAPRPRDRGEGRQDRRAGGKA
ncbi:MAG: hypothetical protein ACLTDR_11685 [Adlercreutzia equolifaciens]